MKVLMALIAVAVVILSHSSVAAQAALQCGQRAGVTETLQQNFSEQPVSIGLANNGAVIEVFASQNGSFTIMMTQTNGLSCIIAAGDNWENLGTILSGFKI
jgi:hypothetical protein